MCARTVWCGGCSCEPGFVNQCATVCVNEYYVLRTLESTFEHATPVRCSYRCSGNRTDNFRDEYTRVRVRNMKCKL